MKRINWIQNIGDENWIYYAYIGEIRISLVLEKFLTFGMLYNIDDTFENECKTLLAFESVENCIYFAENYFIENLIKL